MQVPYPLFVVLRFINLCYLYYVSKIYLMALRTLHCLHSECILDVSTTSCIIYVENISEQSCSKI